MDVESRSCRPAGGRFPGMDEQQPLGLAPRPRSDWISQREVAELIGITEQTASAWARKGKLKVFEHGVAIGGRRRYSRALVERELRFRWEQALRNQAGAGQPEEGDNPP